MVVKGCLWELDKAFGLEPFLCKQWLGAEIGKSDELVEMNSGKVKACISVDGIGTSATLNILLNTL